MIGGNVVIKATLTVSKECPECKKKLDRTTQEDVHCDCGFVWKEKA